MPQRKAPKLHLITDELKEQTLEQQVNLINTTTPSRKKPFKEQVHLHQQQSPPYIILLLANPPVELVQLANPHIRFVPYSELPIYFRRFSHY